jgi:hypothetical protein
MIAARSIIRRDPRRRLFRGKHRPMLAVWCWCGRFYTLTPEQARAGEDNPCPNTDCGRGEQ